MKTNILILILFFISFGIFSQEEYIYYDGNEPRTIYLLTEYGAMVNTGNTNLRSALKDIVPVHSKGSLSIYKITSQGLKSALRNSQEDKNILQVFSENKSLDRYIIPSGNIVVQFELGFQKDEVYKWATDNGYKILNNIFGNFYLIESPPGVTAIQIANKIRNMEHILSATPDLIKPFSTR